MKQLKKSPKKPKTKTPQNPPTRTRKRKNTRKLTVGKLMSQAMAKQNQKKKIKKKISIDFNFSSNKFTRNLSGLKSMNISQNDFQLINLLFTRIENTSNLIYMRNGLCYLIGLLGIIGGLFYFTIVIPFICLIIAGMGLVGRECWRNFFFKKFIDEDMDYFQGMFQTENSEDGDKLQNLKFRVVGQYEKNHILRVNIEKIFESSKNSPKKSSRKTFSTLAGNLPTKGSFAQDHLETEERGLNDEEETPNAEKVQRSERRKKTAKLKSMLAVVNSENILAQRRLELKEMELKDKLKSAKIIGKKSSLEDILEEGKKMPKSMRALRGKKDKKSRSNSPKKSSKKSSKKKKNKKKGKKDDKEEGKG